MGQDKACGIQYQLPLSPDQKAQTHDTGYQLMQGCKAR